ncbi:MAG TPA: 6,7-dimethyl-8-ribityllumazine synthase [bacterium]|nr:6,7-dimethyl-8-ribityllumazine synthase [bacterium]HOZ20569.1 6,7-dimethyl-8-ribityllumazine synthase [bacterium]
MPKVIEGQLSASGKSFAIVVSRFNELICKKLLEGALDCLKRHGGDLDQVTIVWVPGAFEIPVAAKRLARSKEYDAVICLGAVIRGATPHFEYIAAEVTKGIAQAGMELEVPISYGVITPDNLEQALERAGTKAGNKGWDAAMSAIEMADLFAHLKG